MNKKVSVCCRPLNDTTQKQAPVTSMSNNLNLIVPDLVLLSQLAAPILITSQYTICSYTADSEPFYAILGVYRQRAHN